MNKIILLLLISSSVFLWAEGEPEVKMVIDYFDTTNTSDANGRIFADLMQEMVYKAGFYTIIDRSKLRQVLIEHELMESGVVNDTARIRGGEILDADKLMTGSIINKGRVTYITIKVIDIKSGRVDYTGVFKITPDIDVKKLIRSQLKKEGIFKGKRHKKYRGEPVSE